jgi:hypothetical protein
MIFGDIKWFNFINWLLQFVIKRNVLWMLSGQILVFSFSIKRFHLNLFDTKKQFLDH